MRLSNPSCTSQHDSNSSIMAARLYLGLEMKHIIPPQPISQNQLDNLVRMLGNVGKQLENTIVSPTLQNTIVSPTLVTKGIMERTQKEEVFMGPGSLVFACLSLLLTPTYRVLRLFSPILHNR